MQFEEQIKHMREVYDLFYEFLESDEIEMNDLDIFQPAKYHHLMIILEKLQEEGKHNQMIEFLRLLNKISKNHHGNSNFKAKIEHILHYFSDTIKQTLSNYEIYKLFKKNKKILYFLIKEKILEVDETVSECLYQIPTYCHFFWPEILSHVNSKMAKIDDNEFDPAILDNFEEKREKGENDTYICALIRDDSVVEFIQYVNKTNLNLSSQIEPSFYETNSFLLERRPSLIQYACFFGSIQIFKYLQMNNVALTPSLWLYAIHSKSSEIIYQLDENKVVPNGSSYNECLSEAIKCHHNEIANYIWSNNVKVDLKYLDGHSTFYGIVYESIFRYRNYSFFPEKIDNFSAFYYMIKYDYSQLVNLYLTMKGSEYENEII